MLNFWKAFMLINKGGTTCGSKESNSRFWSPPFCSGGLRKSQVAGRHRHPYGHHESHTKNSTSFCLNIRTLFLSLVKTARLLLALGSAWDNHPLRSRRWYTWWSRSFSRALHILWDRCFVHYTFNLQSYNCRCTRLSYSLYNDMFM